jgi:lipopolysaccharide heptosyltransferase II
MQGTLGKTLIIRFSSVGDIVLSTSLVRTLRRRFPQSTMDYLIRSDYAELLRGNPYLSTVLEFPGAGTWRDLQHFRRLIRESGYDLIIDLHGSLRSRALCSGLPNVVRLCKRVVERFFLIHLQWDLYRLGRGAPDVVQRYLETVRPWGVVDDGQGLDLFPDAAAFAQLGKLFSDPLPETLIGICPSARHQTKIWPAEFFAEAGAELARKFQSPLVLFGSAPESPRCEEILRMIHAREPSATVLDASGKLSFLGTAAAMDHCAVILTNDSGLMHIAAARKRKIIAIFGSTVRQFGFFPPPELSILLEQHGLSCRPCTHIGRRECPKGHFRCMREIAPSRAVDAASAFLHA